MTRNYSPGYVIKHGSCWRAVINWQENGKQRRRVKNTGVRCYEDRVDTGTGKITKDNRGKSLAETVLRDWRRELIEQDMSEEKAPSSELTVAKYVQEFIEAKEGSGSVKDVTTRGYRTHLRHLLGSELGNMRMDEVGHADIAAWEHGLSEDGMASATLSHTHVFLKQVFTRARKLGDITSNPMDLVEAPKRRSKPINALPTSEVARLREALDGFGPTPLATGATLALMTGMRLGEVCALRWQDIDFDRGIIRVNHALTRIRGRFELTTPKTATSMRAIPFGPRLRDALLERRRAMEEEAAALDAGWDDGLFVVGSAVEATWKSPQGLSQDWHQLARVLRLTGTQGRPPTFHDLRHTFATIAVSTGVDIKTVSVLLGHADPAMTLRVYADSLEDSKRTGMERLDGIL